MKKQLIRRRYSLLLAFLFSTCVVFAQNTQTTINGKVSDANGSPIPGVSVFEKGTTNGTSTNIDGAFSMNVTSGSTLVFSFIGFQNQEVKIANQTVLNIVLEEESTGLNEVVVVGYGTQKKANLTGAVQTISADVIADRPAASLTHALQGSIAGVNVTVNSGEPGSAAKINIRGTTSISGGSPLVLVDGVEMAMSLVNPDDVETFTVLKDAASSAIYGSRAAFGVVLITTKKGKKNSKPTVNITSYYGFNKPSRQPNNVNAYDYMLSSNEWSIADGKNAPYDDEILADYQAFVDGTGPDHNVGPDGEIISFRNVDWKDLIFAETSPVQKHSASISGGSDRITYYASFGTYDQQGLLKAADDSYDRTNLSLKLDVDLFDWWTVGMKTTMNRSKKNKPVEYNQIGSYWHAIYRTPPTANPDYNEEMGAWNSKTNPLAYLRDGGRENEAIDDNWYTLSTEIRPLKGLKIHGDYTSNRKTRENVVDYRMISYINAGSVLTEPSNDYVRELSDYKDYTAINAWAEYTKSLAEVHNFKLMLGYNQEEIHNKKYWAKRKDKLAGTPNLGLASGEVSVDASAGTRSVRGGFFRFNYNYDERYLIEVNGRYDGTSRFRAEDRFSFKPSISAGWRVMEESFMEWGKEYVSNFKLRASYASMGNQMIKNKVNGNEVLSYQPYLGTMGTSNLSYILGEEKAFAINPASLVDPSLTWETVNTLNYGIDITAFNNKLDISFDKFTRETIDMLLPQSGPAMIGAAYPKVNGADLKTEGWELSMTWRDNIGKDFSYDVTLALADSQAEITKYDNPNGDINKYYVGQKLGEIWGYETVGIFSSQEEIDAQGVDYSLFRNLDSQPGDVQYRDINEDGAINKGSQTLEDHGDWNVIGNSTARYNYGITANMRYKGFDLGLFFQGVGKRDLWVGNTLFFGHIAQNWTVPTKWTYDNYWRPENPDAYLPRNKPDAGVGNSLQQTRYLQNGAYIRLKNVTLGYTLPESITNKVKMERVRFYVSGQNLWEHTKLNKTFDPEGYKEGGKIYPFQRTLAFGANITF